MRRPPVSEFSAGYFKEEPVMSDNSNPYRSPEADINPARPLISQGVLTDLMVSYLKDASPWLRFIGVLGYIGCGFMAVAGAGLVISGAAEVLASERPMERVSSLLPGITPIVLGLVCLFPARFVYGFGAKIRNFLRSGAETDLELAFKNNKSLWKVCGILTIVYIAIIPVVVVIVVIAALSSSGSVF
jgi:hypothetical protein